MMWIGWLLDIGRNNARNRFLNFCVIEKSLLNHVHIVYWY
jgi:hypothetical protein